MDTKTLLNTPYVKRSAVERYTKRLASGQPTGKMNISYLTGAVNALRNNADNN
ncbi:PfWMP4_01 [Phormidium phage Pf-WMP4]|uniref:PfWMP4_01 n=1 Tax=Phormidium phage Pf-WMP4 TaxID=2913979 RepID=Q0GBW5_9CAUD|nr:PfWMP4_01 [Phormidium phage Pf-WMP4]ABI33145.1 PfWMP4_01 [Phormidium phage Pf-WMP4]